MLCAAALSAGLYSCDEEYVDLKYRGTLDLDQLVLKQARDVWNGSESNSVYECQFDADKQARNKVYKLNVALYQNRTAAKEAVVDLVVNKDSLSMAIARSAEGGVYKKYAGAELLPEEFYTLQNTKLTLNAGAALSDDVNLIVFCGGFSNSDVLGSAKGWAAGILFNEKAKAAIDRFYARKDTLSLGICNGCQLMAELELLYPEHEKKHKMLHNDSHKFESNFVTLEIPKNHSVMFGSLSGSKLGIWVAHGEGKFDFPYEEKAYHIVAKYNYEGYPANPNGSPWAVAGVCSHDGRHLAMMPHLERAMFPWQCGYYPAERRDDEVTPWIEAFVNARHWIENLK